MRLGLGLGMFMPTAILSGGGPPPGHLYDFTTGSLPSGVAASGGANGSRINASGVLEAATAPRFDYRNGTSLGLLVEAARINLLTYSTDGQRGEYASTNTTRTNVTGANITGGDASRWAETTANGFHVVRRTISGQATGAGQRFALSRIMKYEGRKWGKMQLVGAAFGSNVKQWFDLETNTLGSSLGTIVSAGIIPIDNSHSYLWLVGDSSASGDVLADFTFETADGVETAFTGSTSNTALHSFSQLEKAASASSPILTVASTLTRSADLITVDTPATYTTLRLTYDDDSTQDFTVTPSSTYSLVPASMNRPRVKYIDAI